MKVKTIACLIILGLLVTACGNTKNIHDDRDSPDDSLESEEEISQSLPDKADEKSKSSVKEDSQEPEEPQEPIDTEETEEYLYVSPENLAIVKVEDSNDRFYHYITGTIYNRADRERTLLKITFTLYDEAGNEIGTKSDYLSVLESGHYWEFEVLVPEENVASYSFTELRAYE